MSSEHIHSAECNNESEAGAPEVEGADCNTHGYPQGSIESVVIEDTPRRLVARMPREKDAAAIWRLVQDCDELDPNSPYAYLLLCTDFADAGVVIWAEAETDEAVRNAGESDEPELVGFVLGYRRPSAGDTLFVWQVGVAPGYRGQRIATRMLAMIADRTTTTSDVQFLEATVTPSNMASRMLFTNFARDRSARMHERVAFWSSSFPAASNQDPHEDEIRLRIGPLRRHAA